MKKDKPPLGFDDELRLLRTMLAGASQSPPKGIRGFFHRLAERLAVPRKKLIMKRVQEAEPVKSVPPKKDAA